MNVENKEANWDNYSFAHGRIIYGVTNKRIKIRGLVANLRCTKSTVLWHYGNIACLCEHSIQALKSPTASNFQSRIQRVGNSRKRSSYVNAAEDERFKEQYRLNFLIRRMAELCDGKQATRARDDKRTVIIFGK